MFQQTIKNFSVNFNALNERNTVSRGDLITGHISFDLTKETKVYAITMTLKGKVNVHWSTGGGKKRSRRNFSAKLELFKLTSVLLQENSVTGETAKLQPGTHMYPFSCQIPQGDFPSTFHGAHGHATYSLTVGINRPWHISKDFVTELNFVNRIDTSNPELSAPLSGHNTMTLCCLWCASGPITVTASTEKKAFIPGETVKVICNFSNHSSRTATPTVKLQQEVVYYTHSRVSKRKVIKNLAYVTGQPVPANTSDLRTEIMLPIPLPTSLSISNCSILEVDYIVEVTMSLTAAPDLQVLFPIVLCDTPVNANPPCYL
ncbi:arrestin domain-containing protein 3-like [Morone saxatilis]|uniref:arrestin domain-containing protein 3-like n=1 Tax=Morone saxatilis TaxID=34816 RepID=UPI0015E20E55|nr:arrestin domain-containing protein 3-like [Morone saxatilis]